MYYILYTPDLRFVAYIFKHDMLQTYTVAPNPILRSVDLWFELCNILTSRLFSRGMPDGLFPGVDLEMGSGGQSADPQLIVVDKIGLLKTSHIF
jgi:hypothetical protein